MGEIHKDLFLLRTYSTMFGTLLTSAKLDEIFKQYNHELAVKLKINWNFSLKFTFFFKFQTNHPNVKQTLNEIHVLSATFKAFSGWKAIQYTRDSMNMSPISFLKLSGLPLLYGNNVPYTTYEGDNSVLTQQTARFLLKELQKLQNVKIFY